MLSLKPSYPELRENSIRAVSGGRLHAEQRKAVSAFSLVELLVTIVIIAIIAAMAIPNIPGIINSVNRSRDKRNAQTLAGMAAGARALGYPPWPTKTAAIADLTAGFTVTNPPGSGNLVDFHVDTMTPEDQAKAAAYLDTEGGNLIYVPEGGQSTNL